MQNKNKDRLIFKASLKMLLLVTIENNQKTEKRVTSGARRRYPKTQYKA